MYESLSSPRPPVPIGHEELWVGLVAVKDNKDLGVFHTVYAAVVAARVRVAGLEGRGAAGVLVAAHPAPHQHPRVEHEVNVPQVTRLPRGGGGRGLRQGRGKRC